ncbi:MAG: glycine betaine ABC transporter substrate-binding protein [Eubacteriales bacterium]|nr:glycine betaine ABC transporter substrate-binding protein [Eubacteriales bacterium]
MNMKKITAGIAAGALLAAGTGLGTVSAAAADPVQIATKPMTEQYILGEMLKALIEEKTDYTAEITKGIGGGTSNIQPAMEKGEFDLYPEYTSSGWVMVLGHEAEGVDDADMFDKLKAEYEEKFGMTWVGLYGFNNTFAVAVSKDAAEEYKLETCSDLAGAADKLVFGGNPDYIEREDGFNVLCDTYGLKFKDVKDIDIGLKYAAMEKGDIDVTNGFTTDAQLGNGNIKVLEDDKHLQVNYFCSTVVRQDALSEYPELEETLMLMDGILTDQEMAELNYQVEIDGKDEAQVAEDFLVSKGLIKE